MTSNRRATMRVDQHDSQIRETFEIGSKFRMIDEIVLQVFDARQLHLWRALFESNERSASCHRGDLQENRYWSRNVFQRVLCRWAKSLFAELVT